MKNCRKIITERLFLEPFLDKYISDKYVSWLNDHEVVKYSENRHRQHTIESCSEYAGSFNDSPSCFWAVTLKDTGEHIGNINAHIDSHNSVADVGIMIGDSKCWGKGYGAEAWGGVLDFLLNDLKIRKVTAGTMLANKGMIKIMQRSGMLDDGIRKREFLLDGDEVDIVHMAIFSK